MADKTHRKRWRLWSGACMAIVLVAAFAQPLLALISYAARSQLFSYILLIPFVSAYLLYVRRHQLPKNHVADLPIASVCLAAGLSVLAFTYWSDFAGRAPADNDRLALLTLSSLCCLVAGAFFFFGRAWMRAAAFVDALETASNLPRPKWLTSFSTSAARHFSATA